MDNEGIPPELLVRPVDEELDAAILQMVLEESMINDIPLGFCSADGNGALCQDYAKVSLECGHNVCEYHRVMCLACLHERNRAARKIQGAYYKFVLKKRLHQLATRQDRAATTIIGFFKMIKAKKLRRDLHFKKSRQRFLARFNTITI